MLFWMFMLMALLAGTLLQASLPAWPWLGSARFPMLLGLTIYYALNHKPWTMIIVAFAAGMLQDGLSLVPLGYSATLFCMVALVVGRYRRLVLSEAAVTAAFFGGVASVVVALLLYLLLAHEGVIGCSVSSALLRVAGSGVLGMVTVPLVVVVMAHLHRAIGLVQEEGGDARA